MEVLKSINSICENINKRHLEDVPENCNWCIILYMKFCHITEFLLLGLHERMDFMQELLQDIKKYSSRKCKTLYVEYDDKIPYTNLFYNLVYRLINITDIRDLQNYFLGNIAINGLLDEKCDIIENKINITCEIETLAEYVKCKICKQNANLISGDNLYLCRSCDIIF